MAHRELGIKVLERVKEENIEDFGVLLVSFSKGKEMDIKFYGQT